MPYLYYKKGGFIKTLNFKAKILIIVSLMMLVLPLFSFADSDPMMYIENVTQNENNNVDLNIIMENIETSRKLVALRIDVKYDPSMLEFVQSKAGKDLKATIKYDEDFPDEGRFSIAILSVGGLNKDGLYYSATFKIKEGITEDIPINLEIGEAADEDGNAINIKTQGIVIKTHSNNEEQPLESQTQIQQEETRASEPISNIGDIVTDRIISTDENSELSYEVEDDSVIEVLEDGTIIPNKDGTTEVTLKFNGEDVGTATVKVKDGKLIPIDDTKSQNNLISKNNKINWFGIIVILFWIFIIIKIFKIGRKK